MAVLAASERKRGLSLAELDVVLTERYDTAIPEDHKKLRSNLVAIIHKFARDGTIEDIIALV